MEALFPTATWSSLRDRFYSKYELYQMAWREVDLAKFIVAGAPYGGPIALKRDDRKVQRMRGTGLAERPDIYIFTASGNLTGVIQWDTGKVVAMNWAETEELVVVTEEGIVKMYDINGNFTRTFGMGQEARQFGVHECRIFATGLVVLTREIFQFFSVNQFENPRTRHLADFMPPLTEPPASWTVIDPRFTNSRNVELLVAARDTIYSISASDCIDLKFQGGTVTHMAVSSNGKLLSLISATGNLWVISIDFQKNFCNFNTKTNVPPLQLVWCGADSVVAFWECSLLMIGPSGEWIKYNYDDNDLVHLVPECDGVRVISNTRHEMLRLVPVNTQDIFKIGSTSHAAMLFDAQEHFENESPKADDLIRNIKPYLTEAVNSCIDAAGFEMEPKLQRALLKAASYGKCFLDYYNSDAFVEMCQHLRILNAVRNYEIGIPLTYYQLQRLSLETLIDRLMLRKQHALAFRVAEYMKLKTDRIMVHWASAKVHQNEDDQTLADDIVGRLGEARGVSYADIARTAFKAGKSQLATLLLDHEPKAGDQVPLLMTMQENDIALVKAIESGDTDLVYLVIMDMKRNMQLGDFLRHLHNKPAAVDLLKQYCREHDPHLLSDFFYQEDNKIEMAYVQLREAFKTDKLEKRSVSMKTAMTYLTESKGNQDQFLLKEIEDQLRLYSIQRELEEQSPNHKFINMSVTETLYQCLLLGFAKKADSIRKDFKVPDVRFWWIKCRATAEVKDWAEMDKFVKSKSKSPIGYEPIVNFCIDNHAPSTEIKKYIAKLAIEERAPFYIKCGYFQEALEVAAALKDEKLNDEIRKAQAKSRTLPPQ